MSVIDKKDEEQRLKRSPLYVTVDSRFLGITITVFILILTVKSELLSSSLIATQLILSIPLWIAALASQSKIVDSQSLKKYYLLTKFSSSIALAFLYNVLGLLVVRYVFISTGLMFFALFLAYQIYGAAYHIKIGKTNRIFRDILLILILVFGGILPSLKIIYFSP